MTKYNTPTKRNDDVIISALEAGILYLPHNVLIPCDKYGIQKDGYTWLFYKEGKIKGFPFEEDVKDIPNVSNYYLIR